jgi:hypothetical protein
MWPSPPHFFASLAFCFADINPPSVFYSGCIQTQSLPHTYEGLVRNTTSTMCYFYRATEPAENSAWEYLAGEPCVRCGLGLREIEKEGR